MIQMQLPQSSNRWIVGFIFSLALFVVVNNYFNIRSLGSSEDPTTTVLPSIFTSLTFNEEADPKTVPVTDGAGPKDAASVSPFSQKQPQLRYAEVGAGVIAEAGPGSSGNETKRVNASRVNGLDGAKKNEENERVVEGNEINKNPGPPRQSYHMCHSRDESQENYRVASCRFKNMCLVFDLKGNQAVSWIYIDAEEPQMVYGKNTIRAETLSFSLGIGPHQVDRRLLVEPKRMSADDFARKYPKVEWQMGKSVVFHEYNFENFGHAIADQLMPIFFLQRSFGKVTRNMRLFEFSPWRPVGTTCAWQLKKRGPRYVVTCPKFRKALFPLVTKYPVQPLNKRLNETKIPLCFEDLMGGMQMYSDDCLEGSHGRNTKLKSSCNHGKQPGILEFRKFMLEAAGVEDIPPKKHQVVIWNANVKRWIRGLEKYAGILEKELNVTAVAVDWSKMSVKDQLQFMANSTVYITIPGGGSQVSLFLPRGATAIRLFRYEFLLDFHFYRYMSHITNVEYEVSSKMKPSLIINAVRKAMDRYDAFREESR